MEAPKGYRHALIDFIPEGGALTCLRCGCVIDWDDIEAHERWHDAMGDPQFGIVIVDD